jgi:hypothetical protein
MFGPLTFTCLIYLHKNIGRPWTSSHIFAVFALCSYSNI